MQISCYNRTKLSIFKEASPNVHASFLYMPISKKTLLLILSLVCTTVFAQRKDSMLTRKCATMDELQAMLKKDPSLPQRWKEESDRMLKNFSLTRGGSQARTTGGIPYKVTGNEIVIPVVVHILTDNPNAISDRDVQDQIDALNLDFAALNKDQNAITPEFKARIGQSKIRFALARKDVNGNFTSGIERKTTSATFKQTNYANVKHASTGGMDAWDVTQYYNIWVTRFSDGLLGVATFPFMTTPANEQGVVINNVAFGLNQCYVSADFNLGRTLVHETGHFFYLFHIWGDDDGACTGSDFDVQTGFPLPAACVDDTPNQADASSGYLGGYVTDSCSTVKPGINYANYMDYSNDVSYGMFTKSQVCRMDYTVTAYRPTLAASTADIPPANTTDACLADVQPGGRKCAVVPVVCVNTSITAKLRNLGSTTLTSTTFNIQYDGGSVSTVNWTGTLAPGADTTIVLAAVTAAAGNHTLTIYTSNPNGTNDAYKGNDTLVRQIRIAGAAVAAPLTESFEGATFPPAGWSVSNPDAFITWTRTTAAAFTGTGSAFSNNYQDTTTGQWDDLITPPIDFGTADSSLLTFRLAYRQYTGQSDGLEIWISNDCGGTFIPVYKKSPPELSTVSAITTTNFIPTAAQWRLEQVNLSPYIKQGQNMIVLFRNINGYGNNLFIDDINISRNSLPAVDAGVSAINSPDFICNSTNLAATATILNSGQSTLTSVKVNYKIDSNGTVNTINWTGSLAKGATTTVNINTTVPTAVQHNLIVYTSEPNGVADVLHANDTASKVFTVSPITATPLFESFESATFPPAGWGTANADKSITWKRTNKLATGGTGNNASAMYINNFVYTGNNNIDDIRTPVVQYSNVDSIFLKFDVAAVYNALASPNYPLDTLEVLITSDCGATFTSVYKKWGTTLKTAENPSATTEFIPVSLSQYRTDSIDLTNTVPHTGTFQVVFRNTSNGRNDIYIDNVNVTTKTLPALLKQFGYLVYPNPTQAIFYVQHLKKPTTLKAITIYDMRGSRLYVKQFNGDADSYIPINIANYAMGIYLVELIYTDHTVTERVMKGQ